jgi:hypothetical protein
MCTYSYMNLTNHNYFHCSFVQWLRGIGGAVAAGSGSVCALRVGVETIAPSVLSLRLLAVALVRGVVLVCWYIIAAA